ncbi:rubredoxin family protein [Nannochloropsis oceanica]
MARHATSSILTLLCLALLAVSSFAFMPMRPSLSLSRMKAASLSAPSSRGTRNGRSKGLTAMDMQYWEGEWVCADCGYIYNEQDCGGMRFEDQKRGFKCPQCSAPRRRFAKKVGDKIGVTNDGGDAPILLFSIVGGLAVIGFGIYAALSGI